VDESATITIKNNPMTIRRSEGIMTLTISCRNGSVKQIVLGDTGRALLMGKLPINMLCIFSMQLCR
jgi:hypothetical protein